MKKLSSLKRRHEAFWRREAVDEPLIRLRPARPLRRGGNYSEVTDAFENNQEIDPRNLGHDVLLRPEPSELIEGDLIHGLDLPGMCWSEGYFGCRVSMSEGGVWADPVLEWPEDVRMFLDDGAPVEAWADAIRRGDSELEARAAGRYPIMQPLLRGPVDIMASAIGHEAAALAFLDDPALAARFLHSCTTRFIDLVRAHFASVNPFEDGWVLYGIWSAVPVARTQLDNAVLYSPGMYREHFLPEDRRVFEEFPRTLIHVHSGSLHVGPDLASEPDLDAIQVSLDMPAGPTVEEMVSDLAAIQVRKPLVITGPVTHDELETLRGRLRPEGLCLDLFLAE